MGGGGRTLKGEGFRTDGGRAKKGKLWDDFKRLVYPAGVQYFVLLDPECSSENF